MPKSPSRSGSPKPARLPVNPRRHKVPLEHRRRVPTACNNCNVRRVKCSGTKPCDQCANGNRICEYPTVIEKVTVPRTEIERLRAERALFEQCLQEAVPDAALRQALVSRVKQESFAATPTSLRSPSTSKSTGPPISPVDGYHKQIASGDTPPTQGSQLQDPDGNKRWIGGTSGATFLNNLKKFMSTLKSSLGYNDDTPKNVTPGFLASYGQYQTADSQHLIPDSIKNLTSLPQPRLDNASVWLHKLKSFVQDGDGAFPSGGIYYLGEWSAEDWMGVQACADTQMDLKRSRRLAFYHAAFAYGILLSLTTANSRQIGSLGETFVARARAILGNPLDTPIYTVDDIPTLALLAMYMYEVNRRDQAANYISIAMNLRNIFGGLRDASIEEKDKRIFWTLYCLNRDASCLMGRPVLIQDEAIDLPDPVAQPGFPPPHGLKAHVELARIAGYVVSNTYAMAPQKGIPQYKTPSQQVAEPLAMLAQWYDNLHPSLQITSEVEFPTDRAVCALHMKYNQLLILVLRPIFFLAVKSSIGRDLTNHSNDIREHPDIFLIDKCDEAARRNSILGRHMYKNLSPDGRLIMPDLHHIFNAAIILLLRQMVFLNISTTVTEGVAFAQQVFTKEAFYGDPYGEDCLGVLNDLCAIVSRLRPLRWRDSEHVITEPVEIISEQELAQNLEYPNPGGFGWDGTFTPDTLQGHTNLKEIQDWIEEGGRLKGEDFSPFGSLFANRVGV